MLTLPAGAIAGRPLPILPPGDPSLPPPVPLPEPIGPNVGSHPGSDLYVAGGAGDDRLALKPGGVAFGGGGDDVFVLSSAGGARGPELLGTILDFSDGDRLDFSQLGAKAGELRRVQQADGATRVSVDYDGDGAEDGFVILAAPPSLLPDGIPAMPELPGDVRILPALDDAAAASAMTIQAGQATTALLGWII